MLGRLIPWLKVCIAYLEKKLRSFDHWLEVMPVLPRRTIRASVWRAIRRR